MRAIKFNPAPIAGRSFLLTICLIASSYCLAQAETTIGTSDAERCYNESRLGAMATDVDACTKALKDKNLNVHDLAATYSNRGIIYSNIHDYKKSLADHDKAIELMPELAEAYVNRGNVYYHLQDYQRALADYNKAIELKAKPPVTSWFNKALTLTRMKRFDEARSAFEEALKLDPDSSVIKQRIAELASPDKTD